MKKGIICDICGTKFDSKINNAKYCSYPCRKEGAKRKHEEWKQQNPDYYINASKEHRRKQKLIKEEKRKEYWENIRRIIEQQTGGKFADEEL
ncbi:MAG: hypothetical protein QM227_10620 [Bacillota bacterium]|jgi:hypothetical protein|nr:hypothetical protein [Bacillota bacterium]